MRAIPFSSTLISLLVVGLASCGLVSPGAKRQDVQTGIFWLAGHATRQTVHYELKAGLPIMEGDIVLRFRESSLTPQANTLPGEGYRWKGGIVPYTIDASVSAVGRGNIKRAIAQWQEETPFRFVPRKAHSSYVTFVRGSYTKACFSSVGRQGGQQFIFFNVLGTCSERTLLHEIGHTVGLWHEHSRSDRDAWVKVHYENVERGQAYNFDKTGAVGVELGPYDYCSVMHYGAYTFSASTKPTMQLIKPNSCTHVVGWAKRLSRGDIIAARRLTAAR